LTGMIVAMDIEKDAEELGPGKVLDICVHGHLKYQPHVDCTECMSKDWVPFPEAKDANGYMLADFGRKIVDGSKQSVIGAQVLGIRAHKVPHYGSGEFSQVPHIVSFVLVKYALSQEQDAGKITEAAEKGSNTGSESDFDGSDDGQCLTQ
jgi:hypothetical protein